MDIYERLTGFFEEHEAEITKRLSDTGDQIAEVRRLEEMLIAEVPTLPDSTNHRHLAETFVRWALDAIRDRGKVNSSLTINNVFDSPKAAVSAATVAPPKPTKSPAIRKLRFRLIEEPELSLVDRIIYSYLWKRAHFDRKHKIARTKPLAIRRIRAFTDLRDTTIKASLEKLKQLGLVSGMLVPYPDDKRLRRTRKDVVDYRPMRWLAGVNSTALSVFLEFVRTDPNPNRPKTYGYFRKCLGLSRPTYYRWKKVATAETVLATNETL